MDNLLQEEPIPQILSKHIFNPNGNPTNKEKRPIPINEVPKEDETILNIGDDTETTQPNHLLPNSQLTHITTTLEDIFKATIHQMKANNKTQVDIDQCCYDFSKEISRLKISKDQTFQMRMIFDICKRQLKEKELDRIIERCKVKVDESVRTKGFNRLIEDANRRLEAQEQLESMKGKLDAEIGIVPSKKYKDQQWKEIYNERFLRFQNEKTKKQQKRVEEKKELEKKKEEDIIDLCKVKKAPLNVVEEYGKRLYEEQKNSKGHKGTKVVTQDEKETKEGKEAKGKNDKRQSQDNNTRKTCDDEESRLKAKEEMKIGVNEPNNNNQIEFLKVNLKEHNAHARVKSKSQEKIKEKKIYAFSVNKKEPTAKMKKLKYNDFIPNLNHNSISPKKVCDDKQTNKILNNFFSNQAALH